MLGSRSNASSNSVSSLGVPRTSLIPDTEVAAENEQKKRNITLLCARAASVSFHPQVPMQKSDAWGVVKWCSIVLKLLVRQPGNPLSIILLTSAHWQVQTYSISCPVILLLHMCKSFTFCQTRDPTTKSHLTNRVTGKSNPDADKA